MNNDEIDPPHEQGRDHGCRSSFSGSIFYLFLRVVEQELFPLIRFLALICNLTDIYFCNVSTSNEKNTSQRADVDMNTHRYSYYNPCLVLYGNLF